MIKIENVEIFGWQAAIRGMRNSLNSWEKSDSFEPEIGDNDCSLMEKLAVAGSDHRKFMRMINVTMDITRLVDRYIGIPRRSSGCIWLRGDVI